MDVSDAGSGWGRVGSVRPGGVFSLGRAVCVCEFQSAVVVGG